MMKNSIFNKTFGVFVLFIFVFVAIAPCINVVSKEVKTFENIGDVDEKLVTCYVFDKNGNSQCEVALSADEFKKFYSKFEILNNKITYSPFSSETKDLKLEMVDILDMLGLIPADCSKEDILRLMTPSVNHRRRPLIDFVFKPVMSGRGYAFFCNYATFGEGSQFPVLIFPRLIPIIHLPIPRVFMRWDAIYGVTSCGGLLSGKGFIAEGAQQGFALGFWGIGFSVFLPPVMSFGFIGYALFSTATAENIIPWPPNRPPVVLGENPPDGTIDVPVDLPELSFSLSDYDSDRMNYTVTTNPYIGGDSGQNVKDGDFSFNIFGLESNTEYTWTVIVSDGHDNTEKTFTFHTALEAPIISDPEPVDGDSWVPIDISELSFRLEDLQNDPMDYTVETVPEIGSGSGTGVENGKYSVSVSGLDYTRDYIWYINVTDGKYWVRKAYNFKTQPIMEFNPLDWGWSYRKSITINHSQVAGNLSNFPVLVGMVDSDLASKAQSDGDDILFVDGDGVANRLFHEIELFDDSSGELIIWVNVPSVTDTEDTVLYIYYGNSDCGNQEYPDFVWDSDYCGVWHLDDFEDSTINGNDGVNYDTDDCTGVIGNAKDFDDSANDYISVGDMSEPADGSNSIATFEAWINPDILGKTRTIISKLDTIFEPDKRAYKFEILKTGKIRFSAQSGTWHPDDRIIRFTTDNDLVTTNNWNHVVCVIDLSDRENSKIYYNGEEQSYEILLLGSPPTHFYDINLEERFGYLAQESGSVFYDGSMDEIRISKIYRNAEWILTQYNNQNNVLNFLSIGPEEI
jgi:hypothetical protein